MMKRLAIFLVLATFLVNLAFVGEGWAKTKKAVPKQAKSKAEACLRRNIRPTS